MKRSLVLAAFGVIALATSLARADVFKPISNQAAAKFRAAAKAHARANPPANPVKGATLSMPKENISREATGGLRGVLEYRAVTRATPNRGAIKSAVYRSQAGDITNVRSEGWKNISLPIKPNQRQR